MSRILRSLVCFLLICCMLVNFSPLNAQASAVGATAAITAASTVLSPAGMVVGVTFIALGLSAAANPEGFQNMVDAGVSALESAGTSVKDSMVELLRTVDADGNASYYVDSSLMEDVRSWVYDSGVVTTGVSLPSSAPASAVSAFNSVRNQAYYFVGYDLWDGSIVFASCSKPFRLSSDSTGSYVTNSVSFDICRESNNWTGSFGTKAYVSSVKLYQKGVNDLFSTSLDLTLGSLPSQTSNLSDGTSARQWSEEYTDRGLKVYGGGSGNNNNDGKWFWKVMIPLTALDLLAMSQADQWSGETPKEFDDFSSVEEFEIVSRPEVEFGQGLELAPVTSPDPGTGTNPGTGTDSGDGSGTGNGSWKPPSDPTHFKLVDLSKFFPFCIPFDLFDFFKLLNADPVAPSFTWEIQDLSGQTYGLTVDLSQWDSVAQLFRRLQLFLFVCGLAAASRKFIKW